MQQSRVENLFRQEAIAALQKPTAGRPISLMPRPWFWLAALLVSFLSCTAYFVLSAEVARTTTARGWLVATPGVVRMTNSSAAQVQEIAVEAGDFVEAGDPVVYVSTDSRLSHGSSSAEARLANLRQDLTELDEQIELRRQQEDHQTFAVDRQLGAHESEAIALQSEIANLGRQIELGDDALRRLQAAAVKGAVSELDVLREQRLQAELQQRMALLQQRFSSHNRDQQQLLVARDDVPVNARIERSTLRQQRSHVLQQIDALEAQRLTVLRSPVSGVVATVDVHRGNSMLPQQLLATILPQDYQLSAELYVPSSAVGQLQAGQTVRLTYDAFPKQKYGSYIGTVSYISDFVVMPGDLAGAFRIAEATYKVQVSIDDGPGHAVRSEATLRPGMLLVADVVMEKRSILSWLLEPLDYFGRYS